ncbi:DNA-protecting protein DprA [Aeromicrobium phragmitis]|uniref:DNA-protecting protein DprA n=1 Tax=Aeromicrobium phragmitis TaxID=2478914 RepID=A0A3L8PNG9_9ACTN|nr:DNA-processing protein DprA [Aeromicrobium phragmitis]RLV56957.1 DNA-protecting protein DprA [Aeromicrobium phragmitis]
MKDDRARLLLSLNVEPGDPRLASALREQGGAAALLDAVRRRPAMWPEPWQHVTDGPEDQVEHMLRVGREQGLRWITPGHEEWPEQLAGLDEVETAGGAGGAPLGLWCRGTGHLRLLSEHAVAVVGARDCTTYGAEVAGDIAASAAASGFTVVSGAAFGIDASAHRGGLAAGDAGIAVLACGADLDYPRAHASLLGRIAEYGVVVSEYPPGRAAARSRFLARNRLIAALADGLVVVEAAHRSGSLNTLQWADRLGRTTMAVPGPVTSAQSQGTHDAVRSGKAVLVGSGADVVAELVGFHGRIAKDRAVDVDPVATAVFGQLHDASPRQPAEIARELRIGTLHTVRALRRLEADGAVEATAEGWQRTATSSPAP